MVNIDVLSDEERQAIVCLFFARISKQDPRYVLRNDYWHILEKRYNRKWSTYKNDKDSMDPYFPDNKRKGWVDKPLERRSKLLKSVYDAYKDIDDSELETAVKLIIEQCKSELSKTSFIALRVKQPDVVHAIFNGQKEIVIDGVQDLSESLKNGTIIFVAIGGDVGSSSVDWKPGFYAISHVCKEPYDVGYEKDKRGKPYFKFNIEIDVTFSRTIPRSKFMDYPETYDASYIGPEIHRDRTQAVSSLEDTKAVAIIRATLDLMPELEASFKSLFTEDFMNRVFGSTTRMIATPVQYGQTIEEAVAENSIEQREIEQETLEDAKNEVHLDEYSKNEFLKEVFMTSDDYDLLKSVLLEKKNVVLEGAPGVGKTFMAKRLAYSIMGVKDKSRIKMVQFHQSYTYEDFVVGFRPSETGFKLKYGPFYEFCKKAENSKLPYFFIIDEINRGNVSKIFGELLMLIEGDKRGKEKLNLLYTDEEFTVPDNVYIIGMMNTADRGLALIDYALRRRFAFYDVHPAFDIEQFIDVVTDKKSEKLNRLLAYVREINKAICEDDTLGEGFEIGHSYFCVDNNTAIDGTWIKSTVEFSLIPLIKEYWFDNPDKVDEWSDKLRGVEND